MARRRAPPSWVSRDKEALGAFVHRETAIGKRSWRRKSAASLRRIFPPPPPRSRWAQDGLAGASACGRLLGPSSARCCAPVADCKLVSGKSPFSSRIGSIGVSSLLFLMVTCAKSCLKYWEKAACGLSRGPGERPCSVAQEPTGSSGGGGGGGGGLLRHGRGIHGAGLVV